MTAGWLDRRRLLAVPLAAVLLAGCADSPRADIRDLVEDVTVAANDRDADGVRQAADALAAEIERQQAANDIGTTEATTLLDLARQVREDAALLEQAPPPPSPTRTPSVAPTSASPSPSPTEQESEEPEESESPSPAPSPTPSPTPSRSPSPTGGIVSLSPSPVVTASPSPSSSPTTTQADSPTGSPTPAT